MLLPPLESDTGEVSLDNKKIVSHRHDTEPRTIKVESNCVILQNEATISLKAPQNTAVSAVCNVAQPPRRMTVRVRKLSYALAILACICFFFVNGRATPLTEAGLASSPRTLVLGSGGFLGQRLVEHLEQRGHAVAQVTGREHVDLRSQEALLDFEMREGPFDFVFFIACEVGGAKFLEKEQSQPAILRHNIQMYESVFPWAKQRGIPLLFTSSYMRCVAPRTNAGHSTFLFLTL